MVYLQGGASTPDLQISAQISQKSCISVLTHEKFPGMLLDVGRSQNALAIPDLDHDGDLAEQICRGIRASLLDGGPAVGERMPALRAFAPRIGVAVNTLKSAYDQLVDEGVLAAIPQQGYFVRRRPNGVDGEVRKVFKELSRYYGEEHVRTAFLRIAQQGMS